MEPRPNRAGGEPHLSRKGKLVQKYARATDIDANGSTARAEAAPLAWDGRARTDTALALFAADAVALELALLVITAARLVLWGLGAPVPGLWLAGAGWFLFRLASGLYPPVGITPPEELRRSVRTTMAASAIHLAMLVAAQDLSGPRLAGLLVWLFAIPAVYFARSFVKIRLIRSGRFGAPFVVIGAGEKAARCIREMRGNPELGLVPVAVFGDGPRTSSKGKNAPRNDAPWNDALWNDDGEVEGVPVIGTVADAAAHRLPYPTSHAVIALGRTEADLDRVTALATGLAKRFPNLYVMSDMAGPTNMWLRPRPIGPYLALEMQHQRFSRRQQRIKRAFDLAVAIPVFLLALPFIAIGALMVKLASPGPAFFSQLREGRDGEPIRIWKLRTMVTDADRRLAEHLASNPAARHEWERTLKLRNDPRVIPKIGAFLRRSSIDELPQLWSIVRGDMSLVGPRIMPTHEVNRYSEGGRALRRDVPPGLTGLWQIMYRNNSDLRIREIADGYYVNNWSVWLDGWILLRTVRVVLMSSGAY